MGEKKERPKAKKKARRSPYPETESFLMRIEDWTISYSFGAGRESRFARNGLSEYQHFEIKARMISPKRFAERLVELILMGTRDFDTLLNQPDRGGSRSMVGTLTLRGQRNEFLGSVPASAIWGIMPALAADKVRYIYMSGEPPRYGSAVITYISFDKDFEPEDFLE